MVASEYVIIVMCNVYYVINYYYPRWILQISAGNSNKHNGFLTDVLFVALTEIL